MSWDQVALAILSVIAVALTQGPDRYHRWAPLFGLASQPFWLYSTYTSGLFGIFCLSVLYTLIWMYGAWTNWVAPWLAKSL